MASQKSENKPYRVLARKYRPQNFDELIGQEALVRTLINAIEFGRIAHAFMLTGVRGVGKTTTARIIAKALNYTGPNGQAGPTTGPTDDCPLCRAISEDRHPDVIEMDAASRTGVEDIREILDGVRYAPTEARYKVYVIDEVHMLSKNAFNALLKTLEEPPEHVKFIFATTEIRKVPVTVLSRCQRFDLRRVDVPTLSSHYKMIAEKEGVAAEDEAIALIARAADGSVRDGLSLLDQAIALGGKEITAGQIRDMLGLADRARVMDLLEKALTGDMPGALSIMDDLYRSGGDPLTLIQDLLDFTHILTRLRAIPETAEVKHALAPDELKRAGGVAGHLTMPTLGRTWQILLKGLGEVQMAPDPQSAAEMVIIRLAYAADLPDPADLIRRLKEDGGAVPSKSGVSGNPSARSLQRERAPVGASAGGNGGGARTSLAAAPQAVTENAPVTHTEAATRTLEDIISLLQTAGAYVLASQIYRHVHLVRLEEGRLEFRPAEESSPKLAQDLGKKLQEVTGRRWMVSVSGAPGAPTLAGQAQEARRQQLAQILVLPVIRDIMAVFPGAELTDITGLETGEKDGET